MADSNEQKVQQGITEVTVKQETSAGHVIAQEQIARPTEVSVKKEREIAQSIGFGF